MTALELAQARGIPAKWSYTVREAAEILGVSRNQVYEEIDSGRLRFFLKEGKVRGRRVRPEDLDDWIERCMH